MSANGDGMIEPVHWGARLAVVDDARYTEVGGTAVVVLTRSARIVRLTGDMAALVTRLDGHSVREALADLLEDWDDGERRRVIELLRRCKTLGLLGDVPAGRPPHNLDWTGAVEPASTLTLRATVLSSPTDAAPDEAVQVMLDPSPADLDGSDRAPDAHYENLASSGIVTIIRAPDGVVVTGRFGDLQSDETRSEQARRVLGGFVVPDDSATPARLLARARESAATTTPLGPTDVFGVLIESIDPIAQLRDAAVVEACAVIAESVASRVAGCVCCARPLASRWRSLTTSV